MSHISQIKKKGYKPKRTPLSKLKGKRVVVDCYSLDHKYEDICKLTETLLRNGTLPVFVMDENPHSTKKSSICIENKEEIFRLKHMFANVIREVCIKYLNEGVPYANEGVPNANMIEDIDQIFKHLKYLNGYSPHLRDEVKSILQFFNSIDILYFKQSKENVKKLCAYLNANGHVDYIISNDISLLAYGGKNILRNYYLYDNSDISKVMKFKTQYQLTEFLGKGPQDLNLHFDISEMEPFLQLDVYKIINHTLSLLKK